jgi:hypothetical protein
MEEEKNKRSTGKTLLIVFLSIAGTLICLVIILAAWLWIRNPLNIRAVMMSYFGLNQVEMQVEALPSDTAEPSPGTGSAPNTSAPVIPISDAQREAVENAGIDPDAITFTPEMEECFKGALGEARVQEIINGGVPGPLDIFKARSCL